MGCRSSHLLREQLAADAERKREQDRRLLVASLSPLHCLNSEPREQLLFEWRHSLKCRAEADSRRQLCAKIHRHVQASPHAVHLAVLSYEPGAKHSAAFELVVGVPLRAPPGQFVVYDCRSLIRATLVAVPTRLLELHDPCLREPASRSEACSESASGQHLQHSGQFQLLAVTPESAALEVGRLQQAFHSLLAWNLVWQSRRNQVLVLFVFSLGPAIGQAPAKLAYRSPLRSRPAPVVVGKPSRSLRSHVSPRSFGASAPTSSLDVHVSALSRPPDSPL